jgi:hypothetical protein
MSIPAINQATVEIIKLGTVAAAGSNSKLSEQVLHFQRIPTSTPINKANVQAAFHTAIGALIWPCLSVRYTEQSESIRIVDDPQDQPQLFTQAHAGGIAGDSMALTVSAFLKKTTGKRGKSFRGSLKMYPLGESQTTIATDDELNAGALTVFGTLAAAILAGFTESVSGDKYIPVILSRKLSNLRLLPVASVVATPITGISVRKTLGHMRHRQVKSVY